MPVPGAAGAARAVVGDLDGEAPILDADGHDGRRGGGVADHVGQRLLHDAVGGGADRLRDGVERPALLERDGQPGVAHRCHQVGDLLDARRRRPRRPLAVVAQQPEHRGQLVEHLGARPLDDGERLLGRRRPAVDDVGGRARLHVDGRHGVGDAVVQVTGDPQAILGDPAPGLLLAGVLEVPGPFLQLGEVAAPVAHRLAEEHRGGRPAHEHEVEQHGVRAGGEAGHDEHRAQGDGAGDRRLGGVERQLKKNRAIHPVTNTGPPT